MATPKLTRKQKVFVDAFVATGVGATAAKEAYDIPPNANQLAASIASENLRKPEIAKSIAEKITDEELEIAHKSLLTQVRLDYFVFSKSMSDEEITSHVSAQGLTVLNIRPSDKGKLAFFSLPDAHARGKGVELGYKLKGSFAPEKRLNVNVEVEASPEVQELTKKLNDVYRGTSSGGDGGPTSIVGTQAQD